MKFCVAIWKSISRLGLRFAPGWVMDGHASRLDGQTSFAALFHELPMDIPPFAESDQGQKRVSASFFQSTSAEFLA